MSFSEESDSSSRWHGLGFMLMGFAIAACLQLHLSFVLLIAALGLGIMSRILHSRVRSLSPHGFFSTNEVVFGFLGFVLGALPLFPYIIEKVRSSSVASTAANPFLIANMQRVSFEGLMHAPRALFRFLSFSGSDLTRFSGVTGTGLRGSWEFASQQGGVMPILWGLALIAAGITFLITGTTWARHLRFRARNDFLLGGLPLVSALSFLISIKGPSAHTIWLLAPLSVLLLGEALEQKRRSGVWSKLQPYAVGVWIVGAGAALILASSFALHDRGRASHWGVTRNFMDTRRPLLGGRAEMTEALLQRLHPQVRNFDSNE